LPKELVNTSELNEKLEKAITHNNIYNNEAEELENHKKTLARLEAQIKILKEDIINKEKYLKENEHINIDSIKSRINGAEEANEIFRANERNKEANVKQKEAQKVYDEFTKAIKESTAKMEDGLKKSWSKIPDQKLSLTEQGIAYDGIPYSQISCSEQLRVAVKIAMALNPKLKVIRISDYSLLDDESKKTIQQMAKDENYQVWVETVDGTGEVGFYIEDGEIKDKVPF